MADSFAGLLSTHSHICPPIEYSGRVYIVVRKSSTDNTIEIWSNTQPLTDSWTLKGSWASGNDNAVAACENGSTIALVSIDLGDDIEFSEFNMVTDTFNETGTNLQAQSDVATASHWVSIAAYDNGDLCVAHPQDQTTVDMTDYDSVAFLERLSGTWDSTPTTIDDGGAVDYNYPVVTHIGGDMHFAYYDGTDIQHKSWVSSTLSSAETVNDTAVYATPEPRITSYLAGSTERVIIGWKKSSDQYGYVSFIDNDGTPGAEQNATNTDTGSWHLNVDESNDEVVILFRDESTDDVWLARYDGSWAQTELQDAITSQLMGGLSVYDNDDGDTVAGYFWQTTTLGTIYYDEYVLVAAGGTSYAGAGTGAVEIAASGNAGVDVPASGTDAVTISASGNAGANVPAAGIGTVVISANGSATKSQSASGTGIVEVTASGEAGKSKAGAGTGAIEVSGAGNAGVSIAASGSGAVTISASGDAGEIGTSYAASGSGRFEISGAGDAGVDVPASGIGSIEIAASGNAGVSIAASGIGAVTISASGDAGEIGTSYAASGTGIVEVTASGAAGKSKVGAGTGAIEVSGAGNAGVSIAASGIGAVTISGSGAAFASRSALGSGAVTISASGNAGANRPSSGVGSIIISGSGAAGRITIEPPFMVVEAEVTEYALSELGAGVYATTEADAAEYSISESNDNDYAVIEAVGSIYDVSEDEL